MTLDTIGIKSNIAVKCHWIQLPR